MKKVLHIILVIASFAPLALAQNENAPFLPLDKQVKEQRGGWAGSKQNLSTTFNAERIRLGDKFEAELLGYLGNDIEKHYWVSLFLVAPSYLHGNKPLPHLALLIKQQALSLLRGKLDKESLGDVIRLNVTAAVLSRSLGLLSLSQAYKQDAERLLSTDSDLSAWFPAMDEYEQCLYAWIGRDNINNSSIAPCKKEDTPPGKRPR